MFKVSPSPLIRADIPLGLAVKARTHSRNVTDVARLSSLRRDSAPKLWEMDLPVSIRSSRKITKHESLLVHLSEEDNCRSHRPEPENNFAKPDNKSSTRARTRGPRVLISRAGPPYREAHRRDYAHALITAHARASRASLKYSKISFSLVVPPRRAAQRSAPFSPACACASRWDWFSI